jgi:lysophospholipase L1-like esterase
VRASRFGMVLAALLFSAACNDKSLWKNEPLTTGGDHPPELATWFDGGFSGKVIVVWGNSTVSHGVNFFKQLRVHTAAGSALEGLNPNNILNYGNNGASLTALLSGQGEFSLQAVILAQPDLLIMRGPLINDVRLGGVDLQTAKTRLRSALEQILAASPQTAILLTTENSLLTTDPGGHGWVQPTTAAQAYTDILLQAVMSFKGAYPRVAVLDVMTPIYGAVAPATSPWMRDQLHPNKAGQRAEADLVAVTIGRNRP